MGLFLFDIDGTLITAGTAVHREAFAYVFRAVYGVSLSLDGISAAGRTDAWLLTESLRRRGMNIKEIEAGKAEAFGRMGEYVEEHLGDLRNCVLPGVPEVLLALVEGGQILGLLTGNVGRVAVAKLARAGLAHFFDTGGFGEESEIRADLVPAALEKSSALAGRVLSPGETVVIGDTPLDVEAGKLSGVRTAAIATGPFSVHELELAGADLVLPSLADSKTVIPALIALVS